jgi:hypothetical protein
VVVDDQAVARRRTATVELEALAAARSQAQPA